MKLSIRRGLTLIELTVVLLILAATAGILVPRLVGYTGRAHGATGADNMQEISKAIALYETNTGEMPNGWDSLVVDAGTVATTLVESGTPFVPHTLATDEAEP